MTKGLTTAAMVAWSRSTMLFGALLMGGCAVSGDRPLQLLSGSGPVYPVDAKAQGIEGEVEVRYRVTVDGRVVNARIVRAQPEGLFDSAALAAVRSFRYRPRQIEGKAVAVDDVSSVVRFRLGDDLGYPTREEG
ncbi:MAG: energy transducer TonB [Pseudomonadota bacterium]